MSAAMISWLFSEGSAIGPHLMKRVLTHGSHRVDVLTVGIELWGNNNVAYKHAKLNGPGNSSWRFSNWSVIPDLCDMWLSGSGNKRRTEDAVSHVADIKHCDLKPGQPQQAVGVKS